ncbi:bifunctional metallophosphatase/5'-nucleotidase [Sneathiella sp. P13V-1]|uniref:bifunctional metallophosphatase/5'-nucleotidase n=1 Tax=Sneathiella sp. P13V-1 TaxID=2697366 RepID=UPI00187B3FCA|nr:bifunctional UDP-sugar hydrolase/5'-nucleotidase [Sneathiella sp. P13V-1]MBE7638604.1 bifunctional metallophosphatase/5'-nucleotidase [Sneathiella sp. P13V-1]
MDLVKTKKMFVSIGVMMSLLMIFTAQAIAEGTKITLLHTNDMGEMAGKPGYGGFPELATLLKLHRDENPSAITTFGGDLISPSLMSGLSKGTEMVAMMNALKLDVAVLGNHEFDFGADVARARIKEAKFKWLASNVRTVDGEDALGSTPIFLKKVGDFTVGFFGLTTEETVDLSSPGEKVEFANVIETGNQMVAELKSKGADVIVALTHLDYAEDIKVARQVKGIHVILGGHDHRVIAMQENGVSILQSGSDLRYLGVLDLDVSVVEKRGKKKLQVIPSWEIVATKDIPANPEIAKMVSDYAMALDKELDVAVGKTSVELDTTRVSVRTKQTVFGQFIAESMRQKVGADIGFTNGGGIRGDRTYKAGTVLTRKDILTELPFGNVTVSLEVSGKDLAALVEHSVSKIEDGAGRYGQYANLEFILNASKPAGERVSDIKVGGAPLDITKTYIIATNDYVAKGGDGYAMLKDAKRIVDAAAGELMASTVINAVKDKGGIR